MSIEVVRVDVDPNPYEVQIGPGLLRGAGQLIKRQVDAKRIALVTDEHVADLYGEQLDIELSRAGFQTFGFTVPAGEAAKSWATAGALLEGFAEVGIDRADAVVSLGGGVIGDLAGFAAATYLRGIDFVQVPTTLLAMVDAAVGGKTAVDLAAGKNLAGAFKQPRLVLMDVETLKTLPEGEWRSGLAEVAKSAIIDGPDFLAWIETNSQALLEREPGVVAEAVKRSVGFKARVVSGDEREEGPRECLNYGHTFGHAIEKVAGYGMVAHGHAVAEGIRFAARLAEDAGSAGDEFVARQEALLDALGLGVLDVSLPRQELFNAMRSDKKSRGGAIRFVLADEPGVWTCRAIEDETILSYLDAWSASKAPSGVATENSSEEA